MLLVFMITDTNPQNRVERQHTKQKSLVTIYPKPKLPHDINPLSIVG